MKKKKVVPASNAGQIDGQCGTQLPVTSHCDFYKSIAQVLHRARSRVYRAVNLAMVEAYWHIGRMIVEEERRGEERAYGAFLIRDLAERLTAVFGSGFTQSNLWNFRQFYLVFPLESAGDGKLYALRRELTWTHYRH